MYCYFETKQKHLESIIEKGIVDYASSKYSTNNPYYYVDYKKGISPHYFTHVSGIYLRLYDCKEDQSSRDNARILLNESILKDFSWFFNTQENSGFVFPIDSKLSALTGRRGETFYSVNDIKTHYIQHPEQNVRDGELVLHGLRRLPKDYFEEIVRETKAGVY